MILHRNIYNIQSTDRKRMYDMINALLLFKGSDARERIQACGYEPYNEPCDEEPVGPGKKP
jgi:hypothetical protein